MTLGLLKNVDESWRDVVIHPLESLARGRPGPVLCVRGSGPGSLGPCGQRRLLCAGLKLVALEVVGRVQADGCWGNTRSGAHNSRRKVNSS